MIDLSLKLLNEANRGPVLEVDTNRLFDTNVVVVDKVDLDTVGCAFILGIQIHDRVEVLNGRKISNEILENPFIICKGQI